jgi:8-oxo-dGTP pyrophosphatase MutT (NUDIX family)
VTQRRGGWARFGERTIYESHWVHLGQLDVQAPSGERFGYHVVRLPRIAIALIVNPADEALMLWRYRVLTDQWGYELLGGLVEPGEHPATTAAREALEESGWAPIGEPEKLVEFEPLPGNAVAPVEVFLWRAAQQVGDPSDPDEAGHLEWVPTTRVPELAARGQLLGSGTLVALLYFLAARHTEKSARDQSTPSRYGPRP